MRKILETFENVRIEQEKWGRKEEENGTDSKKSETFCNLNLFNVTLSPSHLRRRDHLLLTSAAGNLLIAKAPFFVLSFDCLQRNVRTEKNETNVWMKKRRPYHTAGKSVTLSNCVVAERRKFLHEHFYERSLSSSLSNSSSFLNSTY